MNAPEPPRGSGIAGLLILFCATAAIAGLAFDFGVAGAPGFWIGAQSGGPAALAAGAVIFCVAAAYVAHWVLRAGEIEGRDADPDA